MGLSTGATCRLTTAPQCFSAAQLLPMNERGDYYLCRIISGAHTEFTFQVSLLDASEYVSVGLEDYASPDAYGMIHRCFRHPEDSKGLGSLVLVDGAFVVTADLAHTWGAMQDLMALATPLHGSATDEDGSASNPRRNL